MSAKPWDRRHALLIGLTATAATLDALTFLHLGKVFASFQSGNVLFLGLGAGGGDWGLIVRAAAVLVAFVAAAALGGRIIGARLRPSAWQTEVRILALEGILLALFAVVWAALDTPADHPAGRVVLLAIGSGAMGIQAALAMALKIPNVMTVALTATLANLGVRAGTDGSAEDPSQPSSRLLVTLCATYTACAAAIAVLPESAAFAAVPLLVLSVTTALDTRRKHAAAVR